MNKKDTLSKIKKVNEIDTALKSFETSITTKVNSVETKVATLETNMEDCASNADLTALGTRVNGIETKVTGTDKALKHLIPIDGAYVPCFLDGSPVLCGVVQSNDGTEFTNDLNEKVPNGEITRGELLGNIFDMAVTTAMVDEEVLPEIIGGLAELYAMENGADHDKWAVDFFQVCTQCVPDFWVSLASVSFNRTENKITVQVQMVMYSSIHCSSELQAKLDTGEVTSLVSFHPNSVLLLNTENDVEYTPEGDYNPATKKYVDDACANASGTDPVVYYGGEIIAPSEADGELDAQEATTLTITNEGKLSRKINLGTANSTDIQLDFKYTTPTNAPTIDSNDLIEVNVEAFLYINSGLSSINVNFSFYEDGVLSAGEDMYMFQGGIMPTFEVGHQYQIFISYYINSSSSVIFATIGAIDFCAVSVSEPTGN